MPYWKEGHVEIGGDSRASGASLMDNDQPQDPLDGGHPAPMITIDPLPPQTPQ